MARLVHRHVYVYHIDIKSLINITKQYTRSTNPNPQRTTQIKKQIASIGSLTSLLGGGIGASGGNGALTYSTDLGASPALLGGGGGGGV